MGSLPLTPAWFTQTTISRSAKAAWRACVFLLLALLSNTKHLVPLVILQSPWSSVIKRFHTHLSRPQRGVRSCGSQLHSFCTKNRLVAILLRRWSVECQQPRRYWIPETQGIRKKRDLESDAQSYPAQACAEGLASAFKAHSSLLPLLPFPGGATEAHGSVVWKASVPWWESSFWTSSVCF